MPSWFWQLIKFAVVGSINTAVDFGVLNLLIFFTALSSGIYFSIFKAISFIVANINSYFLNRFWTFRAGGEYLKFFIISLGGLIINVGISSLLVNLVMPQFGIGPVLWANIGAAFGAGAGLLWNFLGYKFMVFKT